MNSVVPAVESIHGINLYGIVLVPPGRLPKVYYKIMVIFICIVCVYCSILMVLSMYTMLKLSLWKEAYIL